MHVLYLVRQNSSFLVRFEVLTPITEQYSPLDTIKGDLRMFQRNLLPPSSGSNCVSSEHPKEARSTQSGLLFDPKMEVVLFLYSVV
jgi:hypothetical protein